MLPAPLRLFLSIGILIFFILIILFLKRKALSLKYTLLWILAGIMMGVLVIFPQVMRLVIGIIGIKSVMNGLFTLSIFFMLILLMSITSIVSKQSNQIKILAQNIAFLEKRVRELEKNHDEEE
jgi:Uncharacterized conserved protein (DUF2304).